MNTMDDSTSKRPNSGGASNKQIPNPTNRRIRAVLSSLQKPKSPIGETAQVRPWVFKKANWIAAALSGPLAAWLGAVPCPAQMPLSLPRVWLACCSIGHDCRRWTHFAPTRRHLAEFERREFVVACAWEKLKLDQKTGDC